MPNWCSGVVEVKGKPKDIEKFCRLFVFSGDVDKETKRKYFARSFISESWEDFKKSTLGGNEIEFCVDFAWSCWSCIFEGYPNGKECVTLEWALNKYDVEVEITTEEGGMGFEEHITTKDRKPIYESVEMPTYTCNNCGCKQIISSHYDLDSEECYECGKVGLWEDTLKKLLEKKVNQDEINKYKE